MLSKITVMTFAALSCLALYSAASAQKIQYFFEAGTDFAQYKTYKWQRADDARYPDAMVDTILMRTIDEQLASKGMTKTESDAADVYIIYQLAIVDDMSWSSFNSGGGWTGGYQYNPGFAGAATNSTEMIRKGQLIVDIYDVKQKKQVWQALATKTVGKGTDPAEVEKNARKVMAKIFKPFPPRGK